MAPRTIDNLGIETSTRYAQDQKELDPALLRESRAVAPQAEIESVTPSFPSEVEQLFGLEKRNLTWASFLAPPKYSEQKKRLFSYHIIPSLGPEEKKEAQITKVKNFLPQEREGDKEEKSNKQREWEMKREKEEEEKEKKILLTLLNSMSDLDKFLSAVNARRSQYQRG